MTANQINYWSLQETKRSNQAKERETNRHNEETERENRRVNSGQLKRWDYQNGVDVANAVTGGIKNVSSALFGNGGLIGAVSNIGGGIAKAAIGF